MSVLYLDQSFIIINRKKTHLNLSFFFSVVYLTLALNIPVKIYSLIHANTEAVENTNINQGIRFK